jgi:glycosyltransferase involved in cell wall biosynthesis
MKPLVSILIPAYNAAPWIAETIQSALAQTWPRREIIVVDDGSKDATVTVARQFASKEVSVVPQENQGAAAARNKAASLCQGDYIQWLDADDLLGPDKIAAQMEFAERVANPRILYSSGWGYFFKRARKAKFTPTALWADLTPVEWLRQKMAHGYHMQTATWLVSRELTTAAGPWNTGLASDDDGEYFCRVLLASERIVFVPKSKVYYRRSSASQLSYLGQSQRKLEPLWSSMRLHVQYLRSLDDSESARAICLKYLHLWAVFFYPDRMDLVKRVENLAAELGGTLSPPELSWKYIWLEKLLGWKMTRQIQMRYNLKKSALLQSYDALMYRFEKGNKL